VLGARTAVSPAALVFTPDSWNVTQLATATSLEAPSRAAIEWSGVTATTASASAARPAAAAALTQRVAMLVVDASALAAVQLSPAQGNTSEDGTATSAFVVLTDASAAPVTLTVSTTRPDQAVAAPATLVLTAADYYVPREVTLTPLHDWVDADDQRYSMVVQYPVTVAGATTTISVSTSLWNLNVDRADVRIDRDALTVNETGALRGRSAA
jgi:hypothetical protein